MPNANFKHFAHLHLIVFIWGFTAVIGKLISIDALPLVWYRMAMAMVLVFIYINLMRFSWRLPIRTVLGLLGTGGTQQGRAQNLGRKESLQKRFGSEF